MKKTLLLLLVLFSFNSIFAQLNVTSFVSQPLCAGEYGEIIINASGGVMPYEYSIDNGVTYLASNVFSNLTVGTYTISVRDNAATVVTQNATVNAIVPLISNTVITSPIMCSGSGGAVITANASGGHSPYVYTLVDLTGGSPNITQVNSNVFYNVDFGVYDMIVRDANNCTTVNPNIVVSNPTALVCSATSSSNAITVQASGGTAPYTFSLNGGPYQSNATFSSLLPGTYIVQVRDAHGCVSNANSIAVFNSSFSVTITRDVYNNLTANVTGGTAPYSYQWEFNGVAIPGANSDSMNSPGQSGTISVIVTDNAGLIVTDSYLVPGFAIQANDDVFAVYSSSTIITVLATSALDNDTIEFGPVNGPIGNTAVTLTPLIVPTGFSIDSNGVISVLPGTAPGTYTLTYQICSASYGTCDTATVTITIVNQGFLLNAFIDSNNNGSKDAGESNFSQGQFGYELNNSGNVNYVTSSSGSYLINESNPANVYNLIYTVNPAFSAQYAVAPTSYNNVSIDPNAGLVVYNFPVTELPFYDLVVSVNPNGASPRPGFLYTDTIIYRNNGNQNIASGTITFTNNSTVTIFNTSQAGVTNTPNGFTYDFTNLMPGQWRYINVTMQVPTIPTVALGQTLTNSASVTIPTGDINVSNNSSSLTQVIVGSYDPNDITEAHGGKIVHSTFTSNDYLTYTIQFENTGTANAENVRVHDVLDSKLDETSVRMIDASHGYTLNRVGNDLNWNFNGIDLPASGGKGYINFQVKPKPGYAVGDIIPNTANIYFDFNPAIVTNTFNTEFVSALSTAQFANTSFVAYPNPTNGQLTISLKNNASLIDTVEVNTLLGKTVQTNVIHNSTAVLDLSNLSRGIYFVKVKSEGEEKVMKIVKE